LWTRRGELNYPRPSYAAWRGGGPWLCRVRWPSGLVAVVVPSLLSRSAQPHRWIAVRGWNPHAGTRVGRAVGPPRDRGVVWGAAQALAGRGGAGEGRGGGGGGRRGRGRAGGGW